MNILVFAVNMTSVKIEPGTEGRPEGLFFSEIDISYSEIKQECLEYASNDDQQTSKQW